MTSRTTSSTKSKTAKIIADAVAELTSKAIEPQLDPFKETLISLSREVGERLEAQRVLVQEIADVKVNVAEATEEMFNQATTFKTLAKELQSTEERESLKTALATLESNLTRLDTGYQEQSAQLQRTIEEVRSVLVDVSGSLSEGVAATGRATEALQDEEQRRERTVGRLAEVATRWESRLDLAAKQYDDRIGQLDEVREALSRNGDEMSAVTQRLAQHASVVSRGTEAFEETHRKLDNVLEAVSSRLDTLNAEHERRIKEILELRGTIEEVRDETAALVPQLGRSLEFLDNDEKRLQRIDAVGVRLDEIASRLDRLEARASLSKYLLISSVVLLVLLGAGQIWSLVA